MLSLLAITLSLSSLQLASAAPYNMSTNGHARRDGDQLPPWVDMYQQLQSAIPFVQFELSETKANSKSGPLVIDLKDCGSLGYPGVQTVRVYRRTDKFGQNAVRLCQTFRLGPQLHESPNRFSIGVADTTSPYGLAAQEGKDVSLIKADPLFYADQRFQLLCEKPGDGDKEDYFGVNCLLNADGSAADNGDKDDNRCLLVQGYKEDYDERKVGDDYKLGFGSCDASKKFVGNVWNVKKRSKCFSPQSHIVDLQPGTNPPNPPDGC